MLAKRIIPCLDINEGRVVKGINFQNLKDSGDPVALAKYYYNKGADELVFLDIAASSDNRSTVYEMVNKVARNIFIPFTVGGGIRNTDNMKKILNRGADKISVNTAAVKNPKLISQGAKIFGSQCIVVAVDVKKNGKKWNVYIKGGREDTGIDALEWIKTACSLGAGEILLTSMDRDGTKSGYDIELLKEVKKIVTVPIIASGGAGTLEQLYQGLKVADAALAASIFHNKEVGIGKVKKYLISKQLTIRP